jgi:hypothetical protein
MAKNWEKVEIGMVKGKATLVPKKDEPVKSAEGGRPHLFNTKNIKSKSFEDLKKEGDNLYLERVAQEDHLVDAYNDGRVKSKDAARQAKSIIKRREKEAAEAAAKAASEARRDAIVDTDTVIA